MQHINANPPRSTVGGVEAWGPARERVLTWHDPSPTIELARTMDGHEYLTAISDGRLPPAPITRLAGIEAISIAHGEVTYRCTPDEYFLNPIGLIHGGLACTLLDYAAASALMTTLPAGTSFTTIELKVSYLRPIRPRDAVVVRGWLTKPGRRVAFAEADLRGKNDKLVATASSSLLVVQ